MLRAVIDSLRRTSRDARVALCSVVGFIATTAWWLTQDNRVQDWDNGLHTLAAFVIKHQIAVGQLTRPFTDFDTYPPFGHLVGALGVFIGGPSPASVILASNVVFVPLLAAGCYGVARLAYGTSLAGLLAALFALGTPMIVSEMHEFLLDPQQAAMIAVSVWAILASDRFERPWISALAGALSGLAMLTKQTSVIFLAGLLAIVVLRGGVRNWRGMVAYAGAFAVVGGPWYLYQSGELSALVSLHAGPGAGTEAGGIYPPRFSRKGFGWYFWDAVNIQLLVPLTIAFLIGVAIAVKACARRWAPGDLRPELLGGAFASWLGMTLITHKDMRYTLPALVYIAVLGSGWIATSRRHRRALITALVAVVAINVIGVSTGVGSPVRIALAGAPAGSTLEERHFTFYSPEGWLRGGPGHDGNLLQLMRGLRAVGVRTVTFDAGSSDVIDYNTQGLQVLAIEAGLPPAPTYNPGGLGPHDAFVLRHMPQAGDPPPCQRLNDGSGVYVVLGTAYVPFVNYTFICPGRHPLAYRRTAPLPLALEVQAHPDITGSARALLLRVMLSLRAQGVRMIQFDHALADTPTFQLTGLTRLAALAQLPVPRDYLPQLLPDNAAFMLRQTIKTGGPPACGRLPDGSGLYVILGNPTVAHPRYACRQGG